jgi:hypothetical protein
MKSKFILSSIIWIISLQCFAQWELKDTTEFSARHGLPNFFDKINTKQDVKIGFIGGSITAANGWRPKIVSWLEEQYSINDLFSYSAAIGGTDSKYGVFRIDEHLLSKSDFDLIFIEFAVNDGGASSSDVEKSMEGMVRKIWSKNPYTDICFVYTVNAASLSDCENGKMNMSATKHDSIASYYDIPSVSWTPQTFNRIESDAVVWYDSDYDKTTFLNSSGQYVFTADKVHPTDFGHEVYKDILAKFLLKIDTLRGVKEHFLKPVLITGNYENTAMVKGIVIQSKNYDYVDSTGQLSYLDKFNPIENPYFVSQDTSSTYQFSFIGNEMGLDILVGPTGGRYIIEVDGVKNEFANWDGYCSYYRKQSRFVKLNDLKKHIVKIYPSSQPLTLEEKRNSLNNESRKADFDANPEKYDKNELIFSHIFLNGTLSD